MRDGLYHDVAGRKFNIKVEKEEVYIDIKEGPSFSSNPMSLKRAKAYLDQGFWKQKGKEHEMKIQQNYTI